MVDAEHRLHDSMGSNRQQSFKVRPGRRAFVKTFDQSSYRRRFEQAADRKLSIKARTDAADQTRRQQRMPAKRKKVVVNPNTLQTQDLGKQPPQQLLTRIARKSQSTTPPLTPSPRPPLNLPLPRQR